MSSMRENILSAKKESVNSSFSALFCVDASNKRILKSVQATLDHLDAVLEAKRSGALGDGVLVYGAVEGGFNEEQVRKMKK